MGAGDAPPPAGPEIPDTAARVAAIPRPHAVGAPSGYSRLAWLGLAVACQFCWGIYPAGVRYLQTEGNRPLSSLQLSFLINLMACPALFLGTTLPLWLLKRRSKKQEAQQAQEEHRDASGSGCAPAAPGGGVAANGQEHEPSALPLSDGDSLAEPLLQPSDLESGPPSAAEPPPSCGGGPTARQRALVLAATTSFLTILFLAQVFSLLFTTAYLSQMVFLLAPVMVAFMARALFRSPLPPGLWPALFFMLLGCSMVIGSKAAAAGKPSRPRLGQPWPPLSRGTALGAAPSSTAAPSAAPSNLWAPQAEDARLCAAVFGDGWAATLCGLEGGSDGGSSEGGREGVPSPNKHKKKRKPGLGVRDVVGISLSLLGASALAAFMTTVQRTRGVVSEQEVLWVNFVAQTLLCFALTRHFEWYRWKTMLHMGPGQLGQVALLAAGVNWGCNLLQQLCIRALGAPQAAAFLPVRLLGSLAASYPLLGESLEGPWQWGGAALLLAAVTWYLLQQKEGARSTALAAAMAEADEERSLMSDAR